MIQQRPPLLLRLKLLLRDVHPAVWRRVKLADSLSMADLHRFRIHGRDYDIAYVGGPNFDEDAQSAERIADDDLVAGFVAETPR